jgi:prepilin-type N-terminal cleavage/methylation domain-containing protein
MEYNNCNKKSVPLFLIIKNMVMKKSKAFTLIELLVVIAIIGILSGFVVISMNGAINAANDAKRKTNLDTIKKAALMLSVANGSYPVEAGCTIGSCTTLDPLIRAYIPSVNDGTYTYQSNGTTFTLSSNLSTGYSYQFDSSTNSYSTNTPAAGSCGSKNGKYAASTPTGAEACATGTITGMTGTYSWTCVNGGLSSETCATVTATYAIQSFTTVGTASWTVPAGVTSVEYLVVGGGGGGSGMYSGGYYISGGGGSGGFVTGTLSVSSSVSLGVGAGGTGGPTGANGGQGGNSFFGTITGYGGGGGGTYSGPGLAGGSGGGASAPGNPGTSPGGAATQSGSSSGGYGNSGGSGINDGAGGNMAGGGGGGAGSVGGNASSAHAGNGGAGLVSNITGTATYYAGGGGGTAYSGQGSVGTGGSGGGGAGNYGLGGSGTSGLGGGGGAGSTGGAGGSGIVIIKYASNN